MNTEEVELLKLKYDLIQSVLNQEMERNRVIESKATIFISFTSILITVLVGCSKLIFNVENEKFIYVYVIVSTLQNIANV